MDYWKHFKEVKIGASIDLIGEQSNYVRHGMEYDVLEQNYFKIKDIKGIDFRITSILHFLNVFNLPQLQQHWIENIGLNASKLSFNILIQPEEQQLSVLPYEYKNIARETIEKHIEFLEEYSNTEHLIDSWHKAITVMYSQNDSYLLAKFFKLNDDKDNIRHQKFEIYFPEYGELRNYVIH